MDTKANSERTPVRSPSPLPSPPRGPPSTPGKQPGEPSNLLSHAALRGRQARSPPCARNSRLSVILSFTCRSTMDGEGEPGKEASRWQAHRGVADPAAASAGEHRKPRRAHLLLMAVVVGTVTTPAIHLFAPSLHSTLDIPIRPPACQSLPSGMRSARCSTFLRYRIYYYVCTRPARGVFPLLS